MVQAYPPFAAVSATVITAVPAGGLYVPSPVIAATMFASRPAPWEMG